MLAHAGSADESLTTLMLAGGLWVGWAGLSRIRGKGFMRLPVTGAWALGVAGLVLIGAGLIVPRQLFPRAAATPSAVAAPRPSSTASISFSKPGPGQVATGPELVVVLRLDGGTIVDASSTRLTPDTGHVHLVLDGKLVSMTYGLVQVVELAGLPPGGHSLEAEFVAADHGPFDPPVTATVRFRTEAA